MTIYQQICSEQIIAIIRGITYDTAPLIADALCRGGIHLAEVTFDQEAAPDNTAAIIKALNQDFKGRMYIGAGTVMSMEQLYAARDAGAAYIISPNADPSIIRETKHMGLVSIPGAFTATEVAESYRAGADIVKVFPSGTAGPAYIRALRGPLPHIPLAAVGGIDLSNIKKYFQAGVCCVGIGSNIIDKQAVSHGDFSRICELAKAYRSCLDQNTD